MLCCSLFLHPFFARSSRLAVFFFGRRLGETVFQELRVAGQASWLATLTLSEPAFVGSSLVPQESACRGRTLYPPLSSPLILALFQSIPLPPWRGRRGLSGDYIILVTELLCFLCPCMPSAEPSVLMSRGLVQGLYTSLCPLNVRLCISHHYPRGAADGPFSCLMLFPCCVTVLLCGLPIYSVITCSLLFSSKRVGFSLFFLSCL